MGLVGGSGYLVGGRALVRPRSLRGSIPSRAEAAGFVVVSASRRPSRESSLGFVWLTVRLLQAVPLALMYSIGTNTGIRSPLAANPEDSLADHLPTQIYLIVKVTPVGGCHGDGV